MSSFDSITSASLPLVTRRKQSSDGLCIEPEIWLLFDFVTRLASGDVHCFNRLDRSPASGLVEDRLLVWEVSLPSDLHCEGDFDLLLRASTKHLASVCHL
jgi:hypothetical protein